MIQTDELIGITLAICGNALVSASLNMQKFVHNRIASMPKPSPNSRKKSPRPAYFSMPLWWGGLVLMIVGELGNFMAFGFAPTSVVSPLGAVTVLCNAAIAPYMLNEKWGRTDFVGTLLAIIGGVTFVYFAPSPSERETRLDISSLAARFSSVGFVVFVAVWGMLTLCVYLLSQVRNEYFARKFAVVYLSLCALFGCMTVVSLKAFSGLLQLQVAGKNQFYGVGSQGFVPYGLILTFVTTGFIQIRILQKSMVFFGSSQVVPIYYLLFTIATMTGGAVVFNEFSYFSRDIDAFFFFVGFLLILSAVFVVSSKGKRLSWAPCLYTPHPPSLLPRGSRRSSRRSSFASSTDDEDRSLIREPKSVDLKNETGVDVLRDLEPVAHFSDDVHAA